MKYKRGFTLIELIVVIAIIAVLGTIIVPGIQDYTARARNATRMAGLSSLELALQQYKEDNAYYPSNNLNWWGESGYGNHPHEGANGYVPNLAPAYIRRLPADPTAGNSNPAVGGSVNNGYLYRSDGTDFKLLSHNAPENPGSHYGDESFKYYDPIRPTWAWATYSAGARNW